MSRHPFLKQFSVSVIALVALVGISSCQSPSSSSVTEGGSAESANTSTDDIALTPVKFTLSWLLQGVDAPLTLAIERGYFEAEGLDVSFERGYGSADTASKIAVGQYDMGYGDMYSMIEFNQKNPDQKLIAVAIASNKAPFALLTLTESGIDSIQDLSGKKLGAPVGDAPRRLWPVLAEQVGIEADAVEWVTMEPKLRESFLLQGNTDAISGFIYSMIPSLTKVGKTSDDLTVFYYTDNGLDFYGNAILVKESFLESNPEVVQAFLKAYLRGFQETLKDPTNGLDSVMAMGDDLMERDAEKLRLQIALDNLLIDEEVETNGLGGVDPVRLKTSIEQTVKGFELASTPSVEEVFNGDFLPPVEDRQVPPESDRQPLE